MDERQFEEFRHESVHLLMDLNEKCKNEFRITTWPRWDYDLDAGTLTFSDAGVPKVIATIQVVGTTSRSSNTWLWSWDNASLPECVKNRVREVRAFGANEGIPQLTEATLPDDEYVGWAMTAIAARLLVAKGGYRCPREDGGFTYVIYMDVHVVGRESTAANSSTSNGTIACDMHGSGTKTFACEHLVINPTQEWISDLPTAENPWPDAWCVQCDALYHEQGEWNEENSGRLKIKLLCHRCYEVLRSQDPTASQ